MNKCKSFAKNIAFVCEIVYVSKKSYFVLTFLSILINALDPVISVFVIKGIVSAAINEISIEEVKFNLAVLMVYVIIANCYMSWYQNKYSLLFRETLNEKLSKKLYSTAGSVKISDYDDPEFYNIFTKAIRETDSRCMEMIEIYIDLFRNILGMIGIIYLIVSIDTTAIFITSIITIVSLIFSLLMSKPKFTREQELIRGYRVKEYVNRVFYLVNYAKEIRLFNMLSHMSKKHENATRDNCNVINKYGKQLFHLSNFHTNIGSFIEPILIIYFLKMIYAGDLEVSSFIAALTASQQYQSLLMGVLVFLPRVRECNLHLQQLLKYFSLDSYGNELLCKKETVNQICVENISFSYSGGKEYVLKDVSLNIRKGDKILITGENGSGKTTFINLLLKFYEPTQGCIKYNNDNYALINPECIWDKFSVCFQESNVYSMSVLENVLMKKNISEKEEKLAMEALDKCKLLDKVNSMKYGVDTVLTKEFDEHGEVLSGGEKQKLFLARMYVRTILGSTEMIILDEAFSSISEEDSKKIIGEIFRTFSDKTIVMISHYHKYEEFFDKKLKL